MDAPHLEAHVHRNSLGEQVWYVDDADEQADEIARPDPQRAALAREAYIRAPPSGFAVNLVV